ncbi:MAG: M1 family metallopeptidase, partial [Verrucomicrobia bacterium]|nr:M1 family metallopeptidase [Cytophagales bacterium]
MKKLFALCLIGLSFYPIYAQKTTELPMPPEFAKAITKGTRTTNGFPGKNYWQNHSDYQIKASLDPATRILKGTETIVYYNQSPDELTQLVLRLYPDIFKRGFQDDGSQGIAEADKNETGVLLSKVLLNGKPAKTQRKGTNLFLPLAQNLLPNSQITLEIDWQYTLPKTTHIREGTYFNTSFMVAYWYPQMAVYDDIDGWDELDYTGQQEFYNDFSNFDVEITMPNSHLVWATGVWQNPDEILKTEISDRYRKALNSDEVIKIVTKEDHKKGILTLGKENNTFRYKAANVPDFAFSASDTYLWDMASVVVDDSTKRRTVVGAVYHPSSRDFREVTSYARQCLNYFSHTLPGVPFPYPSLTVFNGDGGMEFPMMVNDGSFGDEQAAEVTAHEIAHTYFPFYMGINERKYAWMDEGFAQFLPNDMEFFINERTFKPQQDNAEWFIGFISRANDAPLMMPSYKLSSDVYTISAYIRPSQAYAG